MKTQPSTAAAVTGARAMFRTKAEGGMMLRGPMVAYDRDDDRGQKSVEELAADIKKDFGEKQTRVQEIAEKALKEAEKQGALGLETKEVADKALLEMGVVKQQLTDIEQKMARKPGADEDQVKSYGHQVAESEAFKAYQTDGYQGARRFALKAVTAAQAGTAWSARDPEMTSLPRRRLTVRDLLNIVQTTSGSVDYARQTTRTNNAAVVAEGATKPTSAYVWEQINAPVRVIAHLAKITRQAMDDAVQLQGEVDSEMRYGLGLAEETELLTGDGTGQHLTGLIPNATAFSAPIVISGATMIDNLRLGLLQAELALYSSDGIILNPADWAGIELTKTGDGAYVFANPMQMAGPRLWGQPVVSTPAMTIDKFLVGGFKLQTLYDRMAPEVQIASENSDDFEKNLFTMRCEERVALGIKRPGALIYGDFGNV